MRTVYTALILFASLLIGSIQAVDTPVIQVRQAGVTISNSGFDFQPLSANSTFTVTYTIRNLSATMPLGINTPVVIGTVSPGLSVTVSAQPTSPVAPLGSTTMDLTLTVGNVSAWSFTVSVGNTDMNNSNYSWTVKSGTGKAELDVKFKRSPVVMDSDILVGQADTCCLGSTYAFTLNNLGSVPLNCTITLPNGVGQRNPSIAMTSSPLPGVPFTVQPGTPGTILINVVSDLFIYDWNGTVLLTTDDAADSVDETAFQFMIHGNTDYHLGFGFSEEMRVEADVGILEKGEVYKAPAGSEVAVPTSYSFAIVNMHADGDLTIRSPLSLTDPLTGTNCTAVFTAVPAITVAGPPPLSVIGPRAGCPVCSEPFQLITVQVTPSTRGPWSVPVRILTDDSNDEATFDFTITGTAIGTPNLSISKSGTTLTTSGTLTVTTSAPGFTNSNVLVLRNTGTGTILLCNTVPISAAANCTTAASGTLSATSLVPGGTATYTIQSTPTAVGAWSFDLSFTSSDPTPSPFVVTVSGTATPPAPELDVYFSSTQIIDGGTFTPASAIVKHNNAYTLHMKNSGTADLTVSDVVLTGVLTNCTVTLVPLSPFAPITVPATDPSTSSPLVVTVNPPAAGPWSAQLTITCDDADEGSYVVNLSGTAIKLVPQKDCGLGTGFSVLLLLLVAVVTPLTRRRR